MSNTQSSFKNTLIVQQSPSYLTVFYFVYLVFSVCYITYLIALLNWSYLWTPWLLGAEIYNIFTTILFLLTSRLFAFPIKQKPLSNISVDVLIPTLNEPEEIVAMTAIGALHIRGVRNVLILDDGNREHIKELAQHIGAKYFARPTHAHAKAGNMNYGLAQSDAQFVICLDADHVPQPDFIERTSGYFRDENLALVQTPQVFYNTKSFQHRNTGLKNLWNEQTMFYEAIQPGKNIYNAAFFCGTSCILRRKSLDSVGGFATGTATEDIHTSLRLHAKKWNSLFINEKLAHGLAPEDLHEYHKQRVRWGAGSLGLLLRSTDSPLIAPGLSLMQRLCYISSTTAYLQGILKLFYYLLPILFILSLSISAKTSFFSFLLLYVPFFLYSLFITSLFSRRTFHYFYTDQYNAINIFSNIAALKGVLKVQKKFGVSIKMKLKKEGQWIQFLLYTLALLMIGANIYGLVYWFSVVKSTTNLLLNSFLVVQLFWNSFNLFFVFLVLRFLALYDKQPIFPHHFTINREVFVPELSMTVTVQDMSLKGASLLSPADIQKDFLLPLLFVAPGFQLLGKVVETKQLATKNYHLSLLFPPLSMKEKKTLTLFFFHSIIPILFTPSKKMKIAEDKATPEGITTQFKEVKQELLTPA